MRAAVLHTFGAPLRLEDRPIPRAEPGGLVVRVLGAGVCHTDLHMIDGAIASLKLPLVLGHEIAGDAPGLGAVLVFASWGCGRCASCSRGEEQLCRDATEPGWACDGGYADYIAVPSPRYLMPLRGIDPVRAAPLADAGVTPYRAVRRALPWLTDGGTALVIGAGGLGQFAIQYLMLMSDAKIVAMDSSAAKRKRACELGAMDALPPDGEPCDWAVAFDFVGTSETLALAARATKRGGLVVLVGEAGGRIPFGFGAVDHEITMTTSVWGSQADLAAVLDLARAGRLQWEVEEFSLANVNTALDRLRRGEIAGRAVLRP
jgi:alcohol dehydrogenase, propanol-preferring